MKKTAPEERILIKKSEWEKMKDEVKEMMNTMYGTGCDGKPQFVHDITSWIDNKINMEKIDGRQVTMIVMSAIIIFLCVAIIFLMVYFQSQLADLSDICITI